MGFALPEDGRRHEPVKPKLENSAPDEGSLGVKSRQLAEHFRRFRTPTNTRFFNALVEHFSPISENPCLEMYFEYAISTNERGRQVVELIKRFVNLAGRNYMDVGCAYGGFLVAFAEAGATVTGVDTDSQLLELARHNLLDNHISGRLLMRDTTKTEDLREFHGSLDIVTCNDVIEHVADPLALVKNVSAILRSDGFAYFEIPNRFYPRFVLEDGHYKLFGITLLDFPEAEQYFSLHAPGVSYGVHYIGIDECKRLFEHAGMELSVLPESLQNSGLESVLGDIAELGGVAESRLERVPEAVRSLVRERLAQYLRETSLTPRVTLPEQQEFLRLYGTSFWRVIGSKERRFRI